MKPDKFPIGGLNITENKIFILHNIKLAPGDNMYLFTDGYADPFGGEKEKKLMLRNFQKLIAGITHMSMKEQSIKLENHFNDWKGNLEQIDDVLVIGFRI